MSNAGGESTDPRELLFLDQRALRSLEFPELRLDHGPIVIGLDPGLARPPTAHPRSA